MSLSISSELPRIYRARVGRRAGGPDPSEAAIPKTSFAREVIEACKPLDRMIREHGYRTYIFGRTLATVEGIECNEEALFAAAMLHDYAFLEMEKVKDRCFTLVGVEKAEQLLKNSPLSADARHAVLDAITLQLNPVVDLKQGAIQRYTHGGVLLDVLGQRASELDPEGIERVLERHPRLGFTVSGESSLRRHGASVRRSRTRVLLRSGFGTALKTSRWRDGDRSTAVSD
jgi:hypothetical protein